tara:strand:- start:922 stop:2055 length:1134 start_codon:yes stop_codon:yes gene_type:complete
MNKIIVCENCVMDTTDAQITFDKDGICDHCRTFHSDILPNWDTSPKGEKILQKKINMIKHAGRKNDFDCILGVSGGIDSSYLLYKVVSDFGLKPLVFHVDAGWNSQIAVNNIEKLIDKLNLDLFTEVINWEEMKALQLSFFKSGVPHIDVPQDHAFFASMYKFASKYKVKNILTGGNFSTECVRNPTQWMYYQSDSVQLKDIHSKFSDYKLSTFPMTSILWHKLFLPYFKGIKVIRPLDYFPYEKHKATKLLVEKFNFQEYPQKHFESRFTRFYESYWLYKRFGFDTRKVQYSSLILTKQMSRDDALLKLSKPPYDEATIRNDFEYIANKLGISVEELEGYMNLPLKSYNDYKSQSYIYSIGAKLSRIMGLERGGKR